MAARTPSSGKALLQSREEKERGKDDDLRESGAMDRVCDEMCQRRAWSTSVTRHRSVEEHRHVRTREKSSNKASTHLRQVFVSVKDVSGDLGL